MKPILKPPGTKHLQLKYDKQLSKVAFNFILRRCSLARVMAVLGVPLDVGPAGYHSPRHRLPFISRDKGSK